MSYSNNPSVFFLTLGCAKNEADSEAMASALLLANYLIVDEVDYADIVFINTCSFIQSATEESIDAVLELVESEHIKNNKIPVVVCGCMPSRYGQDLTKELPEVAAFLNCKDESNVVILSDKLLGIIRDSDNNILNFKSNYHNIIDSNLSTLDSSNIDDIVQHANKRTYAYVKISDGCSRYCSYCTIPYIRGPYHSFDYSYISKQIDMYIEQGVQEIVLIGQDTGLWGSDLTPDDSLASLLRRLSEKYPNTWFRFMYTQPENVTDELINVVAEKNNICSYFDIPMQHCSSDILHAMNRKGSATSLSALVKKIRDKIDNVAIRTTLMVGFPGETDKDFEELLNFVSDVRFDYVGVFAYSQEENTTAADLPIQINEDEKTYRAEQLRTLADSISSDVISQRVGSNVDLLIEGIEDDGQLFGRTMAQAPEVDGVTYINKGIVCDVVKVTIEDTLMYDMEAVLYV